MDKVSLSRINLLHPKIRQEVLVAYQHLNQNILGSRARLRITQTLRTFQEQDDLYAHGRTRFFDAKGNKTNIVTNARAGQSMHNYGLAFDIVLLSDKNDDGHFETADWSIKSDNDNDCKADWLETAAYFRKLGWAWGGDWKKFPDYPHFEKTFGHTWKSLLDKHHAGDTFTEVIDGKTFKWINL